MVIRPSRKADAHSISNIYVQTWRDTYLGILPFYHLYSMSVSQHERMFLNELQSRRVLSFVAEKAGEVVGFVTGGYERQGGGVYSGEIYALYVLKDQQRKGVGSALVSALATRFGHFGIYSMLVWVLKQNPYRRFYEKINGVYLRTRRMPFTGEVLDVAAYGWIDTSLIHH